MGWNKIFPTSLHSDSEILAHSKLIRVHWGGGCVAISGENDVRFSDNVDFFSASYPEPRQEADGCHMTPKRDSKKVKAPRLFIGKVQRYKKYRKEILLLRNVVCGGVKVALLYIKLTKQKVVCV